MDECLAFGVVTVLFTAAYVYYGRDFSFGTLALAMFFPGLFAPWFVKDHLKFFYQVIGADRGGDAAVYSIFGGLIVIAIISVCAFMVQWLGWGKSDEKPQPYDPNDLMRMVTGFLRAMGEEIGWRCFMLPCLMEMYPAWKALLISGIFWGLYHVPVMLLLTARLTVPRPKLTMAVQCVSVLLSAFPHGWVAVLSGYSLWAPTIMHFTWNRINPVVLGSIYTQQQGQVKGPIWLINGEGLAGCLVMLPVAVLVTLDLTYNN